MAEAKLQKLKVTDLKEMLSKAGLVQSGKKDELIKRLLDAGITGDEPEELVDPDALDHAAVPAAAAAPAAPAPAAAPAPTAPAVPAPSEPAAPPAADAPAASEDKPEEEEELTEEEKKQKARAERFGIPWVRQKKPAATAPKAAPKTEKPAAQPKAEKEKPAAPAAIDATPLGISPEVLARRAAKFGLPEKKASPAKSPAKEETKELSAEETARLAEEEEKKRKRAEKFGIAATNGGDEPDAKKAKV